MPKNGFTLVELMVGLVIGMLCMIMMLMLFKQVSHISLQSSQDAEYDAQLQTSMLIVQKLIQNAGYGSGAVDDIETGTYLSQPAVFWRYVQNVDASPIVYICQGISEQISTENNQKVHRLMVLKKDSCGNSTSVSSGTWQEQQTVIAIRNQSDSPLFQYTLSASNCRPFGIDKQNVGIRQVTLTAPRQYLTGTMANVQTTVCLNNIKTV